MTTKKKGLIVLLLILIILFGYGCYRGISSQYNESIPLVGEGDESSVSSTPTEESTSTPSSSTPGEGEETTPQGQQGQQEITPPVDEEEQSSALSSLTDLVTYVVNPSSDRDNSKAYKTELQVTADDGGTAVPFNLENIMPGDAEEKLYLLNVKHRLNTDIYFTFEPTEMDETLAENLMITVTVTPDDSTTLVDGAVLYQGKFSDIALQDNRIILTDSPTNYSNVAYHIAVSLPTTAGNDCANKKIVGDFIWYGIDTESIPSSNNDHKYSLSIVTPTTDGVVEPEEEIVITNPDTGVYVQRAQHFMGMIVPIMMLVAFVWYKRKKRDHE